MRHRNRIIRRLRIERDRLQTRLNTNSKIYHSLLSSVQTYRSEPTPEGALQYVKYLEERNKTLFKYNCELDRERQLLQGRVGYFESERCLHMCIIAVLLICVLGMAVRIFFF